MQSQTDLECFGISFLYTTKATIIKDSAVVQVSAHSNIMPSPLTFHLSCSVSQTAPGLEEHLRGKVR